MEKKKKQELKNLLRSKIGEKRIERSNKKYKEHILKKMGVDKIKLLKDLEAVQKLQGGDVTINMKK